VLPWYQQPGFRFAGAALLAGLMIGGLVTLALGYKSSPPAPIPERSAADAIASDRAAVATATPAASARPKASARPSKKAKRTLASVPVSSAATAEPTATSTPEDEELGNIPASTPAPTRSAPRRQSVVNKPRTQIKIKPVTKQTPAKASPTPQPSTPPAATPAPTTAAPPPVATATPEPAPKPPKPPKPHPRPGGDGDDDPGPS
jgi:hypothetical protein